MNYIIFCSSRTRSRSLRRYSRSPRNNRNRSPRNFRKKEVKRDEPSPKRPERFDRNDRTDKNPRPTERQREPEAPRVEKPREKPKVVPEEKEFPKKVDDKSSKKNAGEDAKPKQRTSNGADYEKKREYQVKITEQKISYKETVRGKQPESREAKISISSASTPSRTPSPFLKPHERKDYVPPTKPQPEQKLVHKVITKESFTRRSTSEENSKASKTKRKRASSVSSGEPEVVKVSKKDSRKADKTENSASKKDADKKPTHDGSDVESVTSEKSKKKKHKLKKHKKSSKKSKKKDRSPSRDKSSEEEETNVNEYLEKKLREKALVSLMRKNKK